MIRLRTGVLIAAVLTLVSIGFVGGATTQTSDTAAITIEINDSSNGYDKATTNITVEPAQTGTIPDSLDSTTVNAIVAEAGVDTYTQLSTTDILDGYVSYLETGTIGGTQVNSSLSILDMYNYALQNPDEFAAFDEDPAAQPSFTVADQTITPDGGQISVDHNGANAYLQIHHATLPAGWTVERPDSAAGNSDETAWTGTVPNPASLTLIPADDTSVGETVELVAVIDEKSNQETFNVSVEATAAPGDLPAELDPTATNAVVAEAGVGDYSQLGTLDILDAYATYLETGTVGDTEIESSIPILDLYAYRLENPAEFGN